MKHTTEIMVRKTEKEVIYKAVELLQDGKMDIKIEEGQVDESSLWQFFKVEYKDGYDLFLLGKYFERFDKQK